MNLLINKRKADNLVVIDRFINGVCYADGIDRKGMER